MNAQAEKQKSRRCGNRKDADGHQSGLSPSGSKAVVFESTNEKRRKSWTEQWLWTISEALQQV